ncbi:MAG: GTP pyrophosphokinase [Lachnospiraceae bacterium]|nr:GTP pyrophosphokinase [Lachnospiraceae bacterium]
MKDYNALYEKARAIAERAHKGQKDKGGREYILHPIAVSSMCQSKEAKVVALLHDVLEDSDLSPEDLLREGIPGEIVEVVLLLTKKAGYDRDAYIRRIAEHPVAREVKMADLMHNMDPHRDILPEYAEGMKEYRKRYQREYDFLKAFPENDPEV